MLRYLDAFEDFNPLVDRPENGLLWQIGYILQQGKSLIPSSFTITELNEGLEILYQLKSLDQINVVQKEAILRDQGIDTGDGFFSTPVLTNYLSSQLKENQQMQNGAEFRWSWVFAIGALACISDYAWVHLTAFEFNPNAGNGLARSDEGAFNLKHKDALLVDATEYLGFARLYELKETEFASKKAKGQAIRKTKLDNYHPLKQAVITAFKELDEQLSTRKAAKKIYEELPEKLKLISKSEDPPHQFEVWLKQYQTGTLPGQEMLK
jgi:hypothetical protein